MTKSTRWRAKWIGVPRGGDDDAVAPLHFRKEFRLPHPPASATLTVAACGIFEATINGQRVSRDVLAPGWPDYHRRVDVVGYDVGTLLRVGENVIEVILAEGWYAAYLSEPQFRIRYGRDPIVRAQLVIRDANGRESVVGTDASWQAGTGPVTSASLYHGEVHDARKAVSYRREATVMRAPKLELSPKICPAPRVREEIVPRAITQPQPGVWIFDLGENIAGRTRLRVRAPRGSRLTLRFGEMLNADGSLYTANLRSARCTDVYVCAGGGRETWEPRFTFHGFRYVELSGLPGRPTSETITGLVISSDLEEAGSFECSDALLNQLQRCIVRSQKGNFIDLPMDCPQRDERLGWSGDAQIFCKTALYNQHAAPLFRQWMQAMRDGQHKDGAFPDIAPHIILDHGSAGWSDAGVIVPWTVWRMTGDTTVIEENAAAMQRHVEWLERSAPDGIRRDRMFGDWLAADAKNPQFAPTPKDLIGTAYYVRVIDCLREMAVATGRKREAGRLARLARKVRVAFAGEFITRTGRLVGDTQTGYLLALGYDLVPARWRPTAIARLVELVRERDCHLATGFLGTPLICPVLAACGHADVAWQVLMQKTYPGWLYPVINGATTMWERWDSWTHERGFGEVGMNSFNHYAYGAIGEFLYATVGGLDQTPGGVGFQRLRISPQPGGGVTWARMRHRTPQGEATVAWERQRRGFSLEADVPEGCTAEIVMPGARRPRVVETGRHVFRSPI